VAVPLLCELAEGRLLLRELAAGAPAAAWACCGVAAAVGACWGAPAAAWACCGVAAAVWGCCGVGWIQGEPQRGASAGWSWSASCRFSWRRDRWRIDPISVYYDLRSLQLV